MSQRITKGQLAGVVRLIQGGHSISRACLKLRVCKDALGYMRRKNPELDDIIKEAMVVRTRNRVNGICHALTSGYGLSSACREAGVSLVWLRNLCNREPWADTAVQYAIKVRNMNNRSGRKGR